ncbi:SAM-dependent methyltransferase [Immersiella caudata]|uniref:SAM-dependent methyltransferase n=1 Tax=Immersiella caudata TaxID=314043 RepID=A0AA39WD75_9PEZI|nr:SAM-dependent methyltransferase [Immersiella caudata]
MATTSDTAPGAKYYKSVGLTWYDFWVLNLSSTFAWGCPPSSVLEPFFAANFSNEHLDVGVGTGYFPAAALRQKNHQEQQRSITLVDLSPGSLAVAKGRIDGVVDELDTNTVKTRAVLADALQPLPKDEIQQFESISIFYLLHCLPGPTKRKTAIFENLKAHLREDGVLFGATVLGHGVTHNLFGRALMLVYNWAGIFDNRPDGEEEFVEALKRNFRRVEAKVVGRVLLFRAWEPRGGQTQ